jgi:hypothetical protein
MASRRERRLPRGCDGLGPQLVEQGIALGEVQLAQHAHEAAREVDAHRAHERAERRQHAGVHREDHPGRLEQLGHAAGVHRAGTTEGDEADTAQVHAALDGVHACGGGHVLVHDLHHTCGGVTGGGAEVATDLAQRPFGDSRSKRHVAAEEEAGVEVAEQQVRVGDGRLDVPPRP